MLETLKEAVFNANMKLPEYGLVTFTWGNASGIDREKGLVVIKPSGVAYNNMTASDMVVTDLSGKAVIEGTYSPSTDLPTHIELYKAFPNIGGVVHTHSRWATVFAQAGMGILPLGTTHADYFYGAIPCTRPMTDAEISGDYEKETGSVIAELFSDTDPDTIPAALVYTHGPFTWGKCPADAAHNAAVLEEVAFMAWHSLMMNQNLTSMQKRLLDKHYLRKHGEGAYYGQR